MKPEIKVFVQALRAGKPSGAAFQEYCWAKSVVPILPANDVERSNDPLHLPPAWHLSMAQANGADAFDDGKSDDEIEAAFLLGLQTDDARGLLYRPMNDSEKPTAADLIRSMSLDDKMKVADFFGLNAIIRAVAGKEVKLSFAQAGVTRMGGDGEAGSVAKP